MESQTFIEISPSEKEDVCNNCTSFYKWGIHSGDCYKNSKNPVRKMEDDTCEDFTRNENKES